MNERESSILIVGFGDVAERLVLRRRDPSGGSIAHALVRRQPRLQRAAELGATPIEADLSDAASLRVLAETPRWDAIVHLAPPPAQGEVDVHTLHLLAALDTRQVGRFVYISTTGVYGDCAGDWIDESRALNPQSSRAVRRVDAERRVIEWCGSHGTGLTILRVPGIYAEDRLPTDRIANRAPALVDDQDVYSNHIHADDLALIIDLALRDETEWGVVNAVDALPMKMGEYFDRVADHFALPRPPRVVRDQLAALVSPMTLSFMRESRRIRQDKLLTLLERQGQSLRYPSVLDFLQALSARGDSRPQ